MSYANGPRIVTDGLVLCLDAADRNSYSGAGNTWLDLSGQGNNGILTNGPTFSSANGGSLVFDGVNDYIVNDNLPSFNVYCISMWIYSFNIVNSNSSSQRLIQLRYDTINTNYAWLISLGSATSLVENEYISILDVVNNRRTCVVDNGNLSQNIWYNLVFNYENNIYKIYINNILKPTISSSYGHVSLLTNPNRLYLSSSSQANHFNGKISNIIIYNRTLSINEISKNYNATRGRYGI